MRIRIALATALLSGMMVWCTACDNKPAAPTAPETNAVQTSSNAPAPAQPLATPSPSPTPSANTAASSASPTNPPIQAIAPAPAPAVAPVPPPPPPPIVIPRGTTLQVRLVQALGSKLSQTGERFDTSLSSPVVVNGRTVIPVGTKAVGTVTAAHAAGRFKGGATLSFELNSIHLDGQIYPIHTTPLDENSKGKGKRTAAMIGGGAGAGAVIGGIAGGGKGALIGGLIGGGAGTAGAATGNRDITLASETIIGFQMTSSLKLKRATSP